MVGMQSDFWQILLFLKPRQFSFTPRTRRPNQSFLEWCSWSKQTLYYWRVGSENVLVIGDNQ